MTAPPRRRARSPGTARAGRGSRRRSPRASRGRAGSVPRTDPDGSPIIPVPPPTSATGRPPKRWRRSSPKIGTRWPTWSDVGRRVEAVVAGDRPAGRQAGRQARGSWRAGCPATRAREQSAGPGPRARVTVGAGRVVWTWPGGALDRSFTPPMLSCGHSCTPASRGASATDGRSSVAPRRVARRSVESRIAIPILLLVLARLRDWDRVVFAVGAYNHYAAGLPDPKRPSTTSSSSSRRSIYDRTGKIELARFGILKREVVDVRQDPAAR